VIPEIRYRDELGAISCGGLFETFKYEFDMTEEEDREVVLSRYKAILTQKLKDLVRLPAALRPQAGSAIAECKERILAYASKPSTHEDRLDLLEAQAMSLHEFDGTVIQFMTEVRREIQRLEQVCLEIIKLQFPPSTRHTNEIALFNEAGDIILSNDKYKERHP